MRKNTSGSVSLQSEWHMNSRAMTLYLVQGEFTTFRIVETFCLPLMPLLLRYTFRDLLGLIVASMSPNTTISIALDAVFIFASKASTKHHYKRENLLKLFHWTAFLTISLQIHRIVGCALCECELSEKRSVAIQKRLLIEK